MMSNSNVFLILNLGCEMLYVIDQRLKAQCVSLEKSAQVLRDLTTVLLDTRFLNQLMSPTPTDNAILTVQQCRILLTDIASSSLMRLDTYSMDKLWDLMTMIFKWQMFLIKSRNKVLDLTFRHLDGIGKLIPERRKSVQIEVAKTVILDFWDKLGDLKRIEMRNRIFKWLTPFNTKISILLRLGFQNPDGSFQELNADHYVYYANNFGVNIYAKSANFGLSLDKEVMGGESDKNTAKTNEIQSLASQLNMETADGDSTNLIGFQILDEIAFTTDNPENSKRCHEFIHIKSNSSKVDRLLEKLNMNVVEGDGENSANLRGELDVTGQLLEMLDVQDV